MPNGFDLHTMPIAQLRSWLLEHNMQQSEIFCEPDTKGLRMQHRGMHPTEFMALKCMDGRLNLPLIAQIPLGIVQPLRGLGGKFDLGWPYLGEVVTDWVRYSMGKGRDCIILVTYHWSRGDKHRGCRGFSYDEEAARAYTVEFTAQVERMYGERHTTVYPVRLGVETDEDALVFHGVNGKVLDLSKADGYTETDLRTALADLYPDMKQRMLEDLLPLAVGNVRHIAEVRKSNRPIEEAEHRERIIGAGRGFDWLHILNLAFLVGPFDPDLAKPIRTAAKLIADNLKAGRVPDDGIVLLTCAPYREEAGYDVPRATEKVIMLSRFALSVIEDEVPDLKDRVHLITGIVNQHTRRLEEVSL